MGETRTASGTVTFGRDADIELDSNPYLHRLTGAFVDHGDVWWVENLGSKLHLSVVADDGTRTELPPGARHALVEGRGVVRVVAGPAHYEIRYRLATDVSRAPSTTTATDGTLTQTYDTSLTPREIDFLVTFARPYLLGLADAMPTYAEVAELWAVSPKTLDNTLQSIKRKFRTAGLVRDQSLDVLVQIAVQHSLITRADLDWADLESGEPRPASSARRFDTD